MFLYLPYKGFRKKNIFYFAIIQSIKSYIVVVVYENPYSQIFKPLNIRVIILQILNPLHGGRPGNTPSLGGRTPYFCHSVSTELQSIFRIKLIFKFLDDFQKLNTLNEILTICRQLTHQSSLDRHPCWVLYDKVEF